MQSSPSSTAPKPSLSLTLPIESDIVNQLTSLATEDQQARIEQASNLELATLMVISGLASVSSSSSHSQLKFNSIINQLNDELDDTPSARDFLIVKLNGVDWGHVSEQLELKAISFEKERVPEGDRTEFIHSIHIPGQQHSEQQEMISYIARQNPNDSMNIAGYAGVGKTTMIQRLANEFNNKRTVVLTKTKWQWNALRQKMPEDVKVLTIDTLCDFILKNNNAESLWGNRFKRPYNFNSYIKALRLNPMNGLTKEQVASIIGQQVLNFCESANERVETHHFPVDLLLNYGAFSIEDVHSFPVAMYTKMARDLWNQIMRKTADGDLAITPQHALKFMDLTQTPLPGWIERLIIDESHDLSPVFSSIIQRSMQLIISLGDEYQITDTKPRMSLDQEKIRKSAMSDSIRTGYNLSDLFNFVIEQHDKQNTIDPFEGNKKRTTKAVPYDDFIIPNEHCTILTDEYWYILLAMYQLAESGRPFYLMKETKSEIDEFVRQALSLFEGRTALLKYHDLISYNSWSSLVQERGYTNGLIHVDKLFRSGFNIYKWNQLKNAALHRHQKDSWVIGKATEAKSLEFDNIMIAPDLVDSFKIKDAVTIEDKKRQLNKIYTALSRGRHQVFLPKAEGQWLLETIN